MGEPKSGLHHDNRRHASPTVIFPDPVRRMLVCVLAPALLWIGSTRLAAVCSGHGQEFTKPAQVEWLLAAPDVGVKKPWSDVGGRTGMVLLVVTGISLGRPDISLAAVAQPSSRTA
jgi:hypothetical protein